MSVKKNIKKILIQQAIQQKGEMVKREMVAEGIKCKDHTIADFFEVPSDDILTKTSAFSSFLRDGYNQGYYIYCRILLGPAKNRVTIFDRYTQKVKPMIMMGSNNFLGLSYHPDVIKAGQKALKKYGGGTGSYLLNGCFDVHRRLEEKLSEIKGTEAAILFSTGYAANLGTISALVRRHDVAISDRLNHASIIDGCRISEGKVEVFPHNDMGNLERILKASQNHYDGKLIIVDGVFSMNGDLANIPKINELAKKYNARVMVDDAFGTGVFGKHGHGTIEHFGLKNKIDMVMTTFTKALGGTGAALCSSKQVISYLRIFARSTFFSAAPPPANCAMVLKAIEVMEKDPGLIEKLWENREYFVKSLKALGFKLGPSDSAIIPLIVGDEQILREMSKMTHEAGLYISPIPYPAVPKDSVRFRICIMATHTKQDLDEALGILEKAGKKFEII